MDITTVAVTPVQLPVTMWQTVVGVFLPLAIAAIVKPGWGEKTKLWTSVLICLIASVIQVYFEGNFSLTNIPMTFLYTMALAGGSYKVFWQGSGITDLVEKKVNGGGA